MYSVPLLLAQEATVDVAIGGGVVFEALMGLDPVQRFVVMLVAIVCSMVALIAVTGIISGVYSSMVARRELNELKQDMIDRGMNAQEIVEVIEAAPVTDAASRWVRAKFCNKKSGT